MAFSVTKKFGKLSVGAIIFVGLGVPAYQTASDSFQDTVKAAEAAENDAWHTKTRAVTHAALRKEFGERGVSPYFEVMDETHNYNSVPLPIPHLTKLLAVSADQITEISTSHIDARDPFMSSPYDPGCRLKLSNGLIADYENQHFNYLRKAAGLFCNDPEIVNYLRVGLLNENKRTSQVRRISVPEL